MNVRLSLTAPDPHIGRLVPVPSAHAHERVAQRPCTHNRYGFDKLVGYAAAMDRTLEQVQQAAKWDTTVLLRGETGTGKGLVAQVIHEHSARAAGPFVKLNCIALREDLIASEIFGREMPAAAGAPSRRTSRFESAHGGTLFLDEIAELSASVQAWLLRLLDESELQRAGVPGRPCMNVRVIAATKRDLEVEVRAGRFRKDLYFRLSVMPIELPPLRQRVEDIPEIARFLVEKMGKIQDRRLAITARALRALRNYPWPGNVRELENCIERASVMSGDGKIDRDLIRLPASGPRDRVIAPHLRDLRERGRVPPAWSVSIRQSGASHKPSETSPSPSMSN